MPNYRRAWAPAGSFFLTVALADRSSTLLISEIVALRRAFACAMQARPFRIDAIVILPDHLHCIWTLPENDQDFAIRVAHIKATFSRGLSPSERLSRSRLAKRERGIWQRRYWEHRVRDENDFAAHVDYIHINPVKHGHARTVAEWPWSSFHRYVRAGVLAADWARDSVSCISGKSEPVG